MPIPDRKRERKRKRKIKDRLAAAIGTRLIHVRPRNNNDKKKANSEGAAAKHPLYMVLEHGYEDPSYSVLEFAAGAIARSLLHVCDGMSFAAVQTQRGPRIVGVGAELTAVYDPKTGTELMGGRLFDHKMHPVLIPHGGKLYALARNPAVVHGVDFVPWFFVANFSSGTLCGAEWCELPPPPIFPCRLNPLEYRNPPKVRVESYAVVGSHILLSVEVEAQQDKGTCAFDMDAKQWEMVDDKNLPFIGQAVPLGGRRFIARSRAKDGGAAIYYMDVFPPGNTNTGKTELSVVELSEVSEGIVPGQLLYSMGKDSFASFNVQSLDPRPETKWDRARIVHHTYAVESGDDAETNNSVVVVKQQSLIFKLRGQYTCLAHPSPVVAALPMEEECV